MFRELAASKATGITHGLTAFAAASALLVGSPMSGPSLLRVERATASPAGAPNPQRALVGSSVGDVSKALNRINSWSGVNRDVPDYVCTQGASITILNPSKSWVPCGFIGRDHVEIRSAARNEHGHFMAEVKTDADELLFLRDVAGLTWDQVAKVFGVSRRAVHHWTRGGKLNSAHRERLAVLLGEVRGMVDAGSKDVSGDVRRRLLRPDADGRSWIDRSRAAGTDKRGDINRTAISVREMMDANG